MLKGREGKSGAPSADLLVCFPARARHLSLMPKPICSPVRPSEPNKRQNHHHRRRSSFSRGGGGGQAHASPLLWAKTKPTGSDISEPSSPKVTCAGQIKVRPKAAACRSWQSVMEEIEKIHNDKKQRKRLSWAQTLGFKKEIMQFLTCLRAIKFDLRCFGSFPVTEEEEDDDDDEEEDEDAGCHENQVGVEEIDDNEESKTVFSKWFMVLQENQNNGFHKTEETEDFGDDGKTGAPSVPPPNALLLMRCRSAPAKSWLRESTGDHENEENHEKEENLQNREKEKVQEHVKKGQSLKSLMMMEEEKTRKENLVVMRCHSEFYDISSDIAKETWIVGGIKDFLARSRSSKR